MISTNIAYGIKKFLCTIISFPKIFFLPGLIVLLTGCLGPKKINKWVDKHYAEAEKPQKKSTVNYLTVTSTMTHMGDHLSNTENKTSNLLPLILYWQWDYKNTCTLNPQIAIDNFTATVLSYAGKKGLNKKLNGQRVELSIDNMPNVFAVDDKGHMIWIIIWVFGWDELSILPQNKDIVVSYRVLQDNAETKKGVITIPDASKPVYLKMFQSLKKKTMQSLDAYDANITAMSKVVIDKLMAEL